MHSKNDRRPGAALVETALVLPVLILIVLGCVDFGRFASSYMAVANAAREGASFGASHPFTDATFGLWKERVASAVTDEMSGVPGFEAGKLSTVEPTLVASQLDSRVRVQVTYVFQPAIRWPALPQQVVLSRTAEMPVIHAP